VAPYLTSKETSKGWVGDNFPRQFHFFLGATHEKHKFKYFKNMTVKVCKISCNDVYMYIVITHPSFASFFAGEIKNN
jgi:hypothetical protein